MTLVRIKALASLSALALGASILGLVPAQAGHNTDDHSKNLARLAEAPTLLSEWNPTMVAEGSDLAFKGKTLVAGTFQGPALYKILPGRPFIKQVSFLSCPGGQGDVSVFKDLVFVSVDAPRKGPDCDPVSSGAATQADVLAGNFWEGIRIVSIADPKRPQQIAAVDTDCGSHTHTLVPAGNKVYIYVESYPLASGLGPKCNVQSHRKLSVIEVPLADPTKAKVVSTPSVSPAIGCHDVTAVPARKLAFAACISESQVWSIKDPANPTIVAHIPNPQGMQIAHSTAMTWDGKYLALGDEYGGAAGGGGCTGDKDSTVGAMWFYDVTNAKAPELKGHYSLPRVPTHFDTAAEVERFRCTTHNFNIIPFRKPGKYVAVVSYYMGGISVVNFSDPADPKEIGYYLPKEAGVAPDLWSAYWYNGRIYSNDHLSPLGVGTYKLKATGHEQAWFFKGAMNPQTQVLSFK
ncbi:MAG: LVIVD repeat-containing protein [Actinomycetota bacterium]